ncbi:MAG: sensor histidine kinase [Verrucomicrobia bacterium]|nr:sensor histidine kinase [Verrucomicrobiota bacterium]
MTEGVELVVADEGPGISEADKMKLFEKYARLSARPTGGESSLGLGLSIAARMVQIMGGTIRCDSVEGKGATFTVQLPECPAPAEIDS